ncbi:triose-phosphate isomerase [Insolitispirillum peregrinum]|uniref:Triosephosphate isomerase n=1 Tax=Insolitispirillum peregrinum TaxID=80876 RepID=A0A1N7IRB9_9PROT|nr:triose-phosphate isomerase [Insolitispirillum peregrinum]SIS39645.1 triosephosphate isomerase [Insolitispirillum peregrinum]
MTARRPLIAGNWKMNGLKADAELLAGGLASRYKALQKPAFDMLLCPPATLVSVVAGHIAGSGLVLGGQDCHASEKGAHTGDISAWMLRDLGCGYVIVGHSERRADHRESNAVVKDKAQAAQAAGLIAVICIGETEGERDRGEALSVVSEQIRGSLPAGATAQNTVLAYEPVWAIGTGRTPTPDDVAEIHAEARKVANQVMGGGGESLRILYGGSVKPSNAVDFLGLTDVDGALVGGASLKVDDFWAIAQACDA